ncbi:MAG: TIGR00730 family Rossman fold protein [Alphaproteobacteria bacterium]|nr:TIGR00730 family Rossman fold protein [Alphaproteobacteria bacterium]
MSLKHSQSICVFCASSTRVEERYIQEAGEIGRLIALAGKGLVYGGGRNGLMGAVADGALEAGGRVTGVMPDFLAQRESLHTELHQNHVVETMHERQAMMQDLSDAFLILPGGLGTLAELFEVITWKQLERHKKPILILNSYGYWGKMLDFLSQARAEHFIHTGGDDLWQVVENITEVKPLLGVR